MLARLRNRRKTVGGAPPSEVDVEAGKGGPAGEDAGGDGPAAGEADRASASAEDDATDVKSPLRPKSKARDKENIDHNGSDDDAAERRRKAKGKDRVRLGNDEDRDPAAAEDAAGDAATAADAVPSSATNAAATAASETVAAAAALGPADGNEDDDEDDGAAGSRVGRLGDKGATRFARQGIEEGGAAAASNAGTEDGDGTEGSARGRGPASASSITWTAAPFTPRRQRLEREASLYFRPNGLDLVAAEAGNPIVEDLFNRGGIVNEGIHVGDPPAVSTANMNRCEQRLFYEVNEGKDPRRWFGPSGRVAALANPLKPTLNRPSHWHDKTAEYLQTRYQGPQMRSGAAGLAAGQDFYGLDVNIRQLVIYDHPLFNLEMHEARRLRATFEKYVKRREINLVKFYSDKLRSLMAAYDRRDRLLVQQAKDDPVPDQSLSLGHSTSQLSTSMNGAAPSPYKRRSAARSGVDRAHETAVREQVMRDQMAEARRLRDAEEFTDLLLVRELRQIWKNIKTLRTVQRFTSSDVRLLVRRIEPEAGLQARYDAEIARELKEAKATLEFRHQEARTKYQFDLNLYEARRRRFEEALHVAQEERDAEIFRRKRAALQNALMRDDREERERIRSGKDKEADVHASLLGDESNAEMMEIDEEDLPQLPTFDEKPPKAPLDADFAFDEEATRTEVVARYERCKLRPGKPSFVPYRLLDDAAVTDISGLNQKDPLERMEAQRRTAAQKRRYQVKISVNGNAVATTATVSLRSDFTLIFNELFSLQLAQWPRTMTGTLIEVGHLMSSGKTIATFEFKLPGADTDPQMPDGTSPDDVEFQSDINFVPDIEPFGAHNLTEEQRNMPLFKEAAEAAENVPLRYTRGTLECHLQWKGLIDEQEELADVDEDGNAATALTAEQQSSAAKKAAEEDAAAAGFHAPRKAPAPPKTTENLSRKKWQSTQELRNMLRASNLDPNHPKNASIVGVLKTIQGSEDLDKRLRVTVEDKNLLLDDSGAAIRAAGGVPQAESRRHRLLRMRHERKARDDKPVPFADAEITDKMFEAPLTDEQQTDAAQSLTNRKMPEFVKQIRERMQRVDDRKRVVLVSDVVNEMQVPILSLNIGDIAKLFRPRRKLAPTRKTRKPTTAHLKTCNLLIQVTRGYNLPVRKINPFSETQTSNEEVIRPFVEVEFMGNTERTHTNESANPQWNEMLSVPFVPPGSDFTPSTLKEIREVVRFSLYDEKIINNPKDDRETTSTYQRKEKVWLGSFNVPFKYLYNSVKVEGTFRVDKPLKNLSYKRAQPVDELAHINRVEPVMAVRRADGTVSSAPSGPPGTPMRGRRGGAGGQGAATGGSFGMAGRAAASAAGTDESGRAAGTTPEMLIEGEAQASYIGLFMTFDPLLVKSTDDDPSQMMAEFRGFSEYATKFLIGVRNLPQNKSRNVQVMASDMSGNPIALTRFIGKIAPPPELRGDLMRIIRFVALIPFLDDDVAFIRRNNVWATCAQFLELRAGDEEEHAVLLCNYLRYLGKDAYVALGVVEPDGPSAFVMARQEGDWRVWIAHTGRTYMRSDPHCPLESIGCIFNEENLFVNVQKAEDPHDLDMDLTGKGWRSFFTEQYPLDPRAFFCVQKPLRYETTQVTRVQVTEQKVHRAVKTAIEQARSARFKTTENHEASRILKHLLPRFEEAATQGVVVDDDEHQRALLPLLQSHTINGFPLNFTYTTVSDIVKGVLATGLHLVEDDSVTFGMATHVHPYPNNVLSVWVYVAVLTKTT